MRGQGTERQLHPDLKRSTGPAHPSVRMGTGPIDRGVGDDG